MPIWVPGAPPTLTPRALKNAGGVQGGGFYVAVINAQVVNDIVGTVAKELKSQVNGFLRQEAKAIARDIVVPALEQAKQTTTLPRVAKHMEVAPKIDRLVAVKIGARNPKGLIGFKPGRPSSLRNKSTLAWGSEMGPKGGRKTMGRPGWSPPSDLGKVNHYGVVRNERGYWVQPTVNRILPKVVAEYNAALYELWQWAIQSNRRPADVNRWAA